MSAMTDPNTLPFDPDQLRAKYDEEREKRLRADANDQYRELKGEFARYLEDTYSETRIEREALHDEVDVAVIGGGFGGLDCRRVDGHGPELGDLDPRRCSCPGRGRPGA